MTFTTPRTAPLPAGAANGPRGSARGYSVTELVIVVSIMGTLAGIAVGSFNQFLGGAKGALAQERVESLNQGLHRFAQQNYELLFSPVSTATADELVILRTLQYRHEDPDRATIGSPFADPRYNPVANSSVDEYRIRWAGKSYELLKPGTPGTGLLMNFEGTDFTEPFDFPPNFKMVGR